MTSPFVHYQGIGELALEAYSRLNISPQSVMDRVRFYCIYLKDVAPLGLTVHHIPVEPDDKERSPAREEILLTTNSGKIFMSGLVSLEANPANVERTAGHEAYTNWLNGEFTPADDIWRFFTGLSKIRFFSSHLCDEWEARGVFHPIQQAEEVAAFLEKEFYKLEEQERL